MLAIHQIGPEVGMKKAASAFDRVREWSAQVAVDVQDLGPKIEDGK